MPKFLRPPLSLMWGFVVFLCQTYKSKLNPFWYVTYFFVFDTMHNNYWLNYTYLDGCVLPHWKVHGVSTCTQLLEGDIQFCDSMLNTFWIVPVHTAQYAFLRKHTEQLPATVGTPFCGGWCHGEEEAWAFKKEVHSRLFSLHCWVMILHRPHGQHAASRQLHPCVCAWGRNGVSDTQGRGGGCFVNDLRLPLTAVCICV